MARKGYFYILASKKYGTLYCGVTSALDFRVWLHKQGIGSKFTSKYGVKILVYFEEHESIASAIQRETSVKRWKRDWKIALIESVNPDWNDLAESLV
jgi:putative endonuclease